MEKQMYQSLLAIKQKYDELNLLLQTEAVLSNIKKYTKINRDANAIYETVSAFNEFLYCEKIAKDAKEILVNESDKELLDMAKVEQEEAFITMKRLEEKLKILLLPKDENDSKDTIIEIRGAAGGDEANIFAGDLFDLYKKWCAENKMKVEVMEANRGDSGGFTLLVFKVMGNNVYSKLKFESGSHRVQRVPTTETQGRVHTSTATVTVMPMADETVEIEIKPSDIKIDTFRSSGAGGQSVNTTDSAVRITHLASGVVVTCQDGRSQLANREQAMTLLRSKLYKLQLEKAQAESASYRGLAGSGARAEKVRTYNYPQDRVTDHRIGFSMSLKSAMRGELNPIIEALIAAEQEAKIKEAGI